MTIISRLKRRREKKKKELVRMKTPVKQKAGIGMNRQSTTDLLEIPPTKLVNKGGSPNKLVEIDGMTEKAMEIEFQDLVGFSKKPVTIASIANALNFSNRVLNLHAEQGKKFLLHRLMTQMKNMTIHRLRPMQREKESLRRRYDFVNALNRLEKLPESHSETVTCWEEAKTKLEKVFSFSEEADTSEKDLKSTEDGVGLETYKAALECAIATQSSSSSMQPLHEKWKQVAAVTPPSKLYRGSREGDADGSLSLRIQAAEADLESFKSTAIKDVENRLLIHEKEEEAKKRASSLMRPLNDEERETVRRAMYGPGPGSEVIARCGTDSVQRASMQTLQPGQWVGDEVISYFLVMLSKRDEEMCQKDPSRKRCHFFKSFFFTKLLNEGHANPDMDGTYEYRNVKRWSKKVPGKDIFNLDKVIFPLNVQRMHWICAVAFITEKRIQIYDSMGSKGSIYLDSIFRYLQDEHKDKKGVPLPDADQWKLVPTTPDTPRQKNGYDCGVFTCMAADFLSKDCPLVYSQDHITQCRERIALAIMNGKAIM